MVVTMTDYAAEREAMVERQLRRRGITEPDILDAFRAVPREEFVSMEQAHLAYGDHPLPIEAGQTISQPYIVALMIQAAAIKPGDRVLEVGAGSGYAAAVMSRIADQVFAIERHQRLAESAQQRLLDIGYSNVAVLAGDGSLGLPDKAPFDAILVAAGGPSIPEPLAKQLEIGGRMVIPIGSDQKSQVLIRVTRTSKGFETENFGPCAFVPLIGSHGWSGKT